MPGRVLTHMASLPPFTSHTFPDPTCQPLPWHLPFTLAKIRSASTEVKSSSSNMESFQLSKLEWLSMGGTDGCRVGTFWVLWGSLFCETFGNFKSTKILFVQGLWHKFLPRIKHLSESSHVERWECGRVSSKTITYHIALPLVATSTTHKL